MCEFNSTDYPGIVFSKHKKEAEITSEGGVIIGEGIKLTVPPGAVARGNTAKISLQACLGGPFCLPENLAFMSPVYLIGPPFAFHDNLTLSIDLFLKLETQRDCEDVVFVTSPTKKVLNEDDLAQWNFKRFGSPKLTVGERNGEIDLKHFCLAAFAGVFGMTVAFFPSYNQAIKR